MQTTSTNQRSIYFNIPISIFLGLLIGGLTWVFIKALSLIESMHEHLNRDIPYHLVLIPVVIWLIDLAKRNTLYFPFKVADLRREVSSQYWTSLMLPFHFLGTLLSHITGVSVGREGAAVLYSAGLVRVFRMSWLYWGPICTTIGFSAVVGNYWAAVFFISELYERTSFFQKLYAFMGSVVAVLLMQTLGVHTLFPIMDIDTSDLGFFKKLIFFFFFAACAGLIMRVYKKCYFVMSDYFRKQGYLVKSFVALCLAAFLYIPEFRKFQSLGISQIQNLGLMQATFLDSIVKLVVTAVSTALGFFGGEFIPLVYSGVHFGHSFFSYFGFNPLLGAFMAAYLLFAAGTRFKWTSYVLVLTLMGFGWWFWAYFVISIAVSFSGESSLYKKETVN